MNTADEIENEIQAKGLTAPLSGVEMRLERAPHPDVLAQLKCLDALERQFTAFTNSLLNPISAGGITLPRQTLVGREVSLAKTKIEEAAMWAKKAIEKEVP